MRRAQSMNDVTSLQTLHPTRATLLMHAAEDIPEEEEVGDYGFFDTLGEEEDNSSDNEGEGEDTTPVPTPPDVDALKSYLNKKRSPPSVPSVPTAIPPTSIPPTTTTTTAPTTTTTPSLPRPPTPPIKKQPRMKSCISMPNLRTPSLNRSVSFTSLQIRHHLMTLSESPCPYSGPAVGLGEFLNEENVSLNTYELSKPRKRLMYEMKLTEAERRHIVSGAGVEIDEVKSSDKEARRIRNQRSVTNAKGAVVQKLEEGMESLGRKIRRAREKNKVRNANGK
ncbi:hypothetical protein TrST_g4286 [Triparma strigata]|uniref:Uncharacterized protein n=1 Tax=Triparma strigata TaxID=1606541 RepID=A0A9W7C6L6_9STRA|nr:hypothetical protein TrST_g4286 [Triparma strigata]